MPTWHPFEAAIQAHDREGAVTAQGHTFHNHARRLLVRNACDDRAQSKKLVTPYAGPEHGLTNQIDKLTRLGTTG